MKLYKNICNYKLIIVIIWKYHLFCVYLHSKIVGETTCINDFLKRE